MEAIVALDNRFTQCGGTLYDTYTQDARFWADYLEAFDRLRIVGRVRRVAAPPPGAHVVSGPRIAFTSLPYWEGVAGFLRVRKAVRRRLREVAGSAEAAVLRIPGLVGQGLAREMAALGKPYAVEVVEDPATTHARSDVVGKVGDLVYVRGTRWACRQAAAASYVTERFLQARFPAPQATVTAHYSSIRLPRAALRGQPRKAGRGGGPIRLVHVGAMHNERKGQALVVEAVARCRRQGVEVEATFAGAGELLRSHQALARRLGVDRQCRFLGNVPRPEVLRLFGEADLFVLPTRAEGLPRAMLEAMAAALPVLATPVAGIPEVLDPTALVRRDARSLATRVAEVVADPAWLADQSRKNLRTAGAFVEEELAARRVAFYRAYGRLVAGGRPMAVTA